MYLEMKIALGEHLTSIVLSPWYICTGSTYFATPQSSGRLAPQTLEVRSQNRNLQMPSPAQSTEQSVGEGNLRPSNRAAQSPAPSPVLLVERQPSAEDSSAAARLLRTGVIAQNSCLIHEQCGGSCPGRIGVDRHRAYPTDTRSDETGMIAQMAATGPRFGNLGPLTQASHWTVSLDTPRFVYTALDTPDRTIRLLKIKPAIFHKDTLDCELVCFDLANAPVYGALSYCWGTGESTSRILCDGRVFHIRRILERALKRLRRGFGLGGVEEYIWADAICIDQQNLFEKSKQILLMERIYLNAATVYVYLGGFGDLSFSIGGGLSLQFVKGDGGEIDELDDLVLSRNPGLPLQFNTAVSTLCMPWFRRTWAIQEIVLARQSKYIYHGTVFTSQELDILLHKDAIYDNPNRSRELMGSEVVARGYLNYQKIHLIRSLYYAGQKDSLQIIQLTRDFETTDPKDKVFGLLALMTDDDRADIGPYSQSVQAIYRRFAAIHVRRGHAITLLDSAGIQRRKLGKDLLQSWVPDWTAQSDSPKIISSIRPVPYSASGPYAAHVELVGDDAGSSGLRLRGLLIDHLGSVADKRGSFPEDPNFVRYLHRIRATFDKWLRRSRSAYSDNEDAFARLLLMDDTYTGANAIALSSPILDPASTYRDAISYWPAGEHPMPRGGRMNAVQTFKMQVSATCLGRSFATTRNGYIALVPTIAEAGDIVVLLYGATVPYILRPAGGGFVLVGDAFVQGAMYGEAISRLTSREIDPVLV